MLRIVTDRKMAPKTARTAVLTPATKETSAILTWRNPKVKILWLMLYEAPYPCATRRQTCQGKRSL